MESKLVMINYSKKQNKKEIFDWEEFLNELDKMIKKDNERKEKKYGKNNWNREEVK